MSGEGWFLDWEKYNECKRYVRFYDNNVIKLQRERVEARKPSNISGLGWFIYYIAALEKEKHKIGVSDSYYRDIENSLKRHRKELNKRRKEINGRKVTISIVD